MYATHFGMHWGAHSYTPYTHARVYKVEYVRNDDPDGAHLSDLRVNAHRISHCSCVCVRARFKCEFHHHCATRSRLSFSIPPPPILAIYMEEHTYARIIMHRSAIRPIEANTCVG